MKFAYKADGTVVGLNRSGQGEDELTGNCTPQELVWAMESECYTAPSGTLVPMSEQEKSEYDQVKAKDSKLITTLATIDEDVNTAQKEPFEFNGYSFYADERSILAEFSALGYQSEGYTKSWKTTEKEVDGISNIYITLDKVGIAGLALTLLARQGSIWDAGDVQKKQLKLDYNTGA